MVENQKTVSFKLYIKTIFIIKYFLDTDTFCCVFTTLVLKSPRTRSLPGLLGSDARDASIIHRPAFAGARDGSSKAVEAILLSIGHFRLTQLRE